MYTELLDSVSLSSSDAKLGSDLAAILDHPFARVVGERAWAVTQLAAVREEVFHDFCAFCYRVGIEVPPIEEALITVQLPSVTQPQIDAHLFRASVLRQHVVAVTGRDKSKLAIECRTLADAFALLPMRRCGW